MTTAKRSKVKGRRRREIVSVKWDGERSKRRSKIYSQSTPPLTSLVSHALQVLPHFSQHLLLALEVLMVLLIVQNKKNEIITIHIYIHIHVC